LPNVLGVLSLRGFPRAARVIENRLTLSDDFSCRTRKYSVKSA
jgi:hypothetical protein